MATKKRRGRPSKYTEAVAQEICERIAAGESMLKICRDDHLPTRRTVLRWLFDDRSKYDNFRHKYARAREVQAECWADELVDIADESGDDPQHGKLRVDTRKWVAVKLLPRKYGDKQHIQHSGSVANFDPSDFTNEELERIDSGESPEEVLASRKR